MLTDDPSTLSPSVFLVGGYGVVNLIADRAVLLWFEILRKLGVEVAPARGGCRINVEVDSGERHCD